MNPRPADYESAALPTEPPQQTEIIVLYDYINTRLLSQEKMLYFTQKKEEKQPMSDHEEKIGRRIARYRSLAGYTQQTAADAIGINKNSYARMERSGTPKPDVLKKLSDIFNVPVQVLLYGEVDSEITAQAPKSSALKDIGFDIKQDEPLVLTTNEKNIIKLLRSLPQTKRNEILKQLTEEK